jgi:rod shape-determining protein MreD
VLLAVALVAQGTFMHFAIVRGAEPSLVLVFVVWFAMRSDMSRALLFGFFAGAGEDVLAFDPSGTWTIATTATALLASLPSRRFFEDSIPLFSIVTAGATLLRALLYWIIKSVEGYPAGLATVHLHNALEQALLNAFLAIVVMAILRPLDRRPTLPSE